MMLLKHKVAVVAVFAAGGLLATLAWSFVQRHLFIQNTVAFWGPSTMNVFLWGLFFSATMALAGGIALWGRVVAFDKPVRWIRAAAATLVLASAFPLGREVMAYTFIAALPFMRPLVLDPSTAPPPTTMQLVVGAVAGPLGNFLAGVVAALTCALAFRVLGVVRPRRVASCALGFGCLATALMRSQGLMPVFTFLGPWESLARLVEVMTLLGTAMGGLVGYWFLGGSRSQAEGGVQRD